MKIEAQGRMMKKSDFQTLWDEAEGLTFDDSTGLPLGKVSVSTGIGKGISRYVFVKDDDTGATCCYRQSKFNSHWKERANSNAYFVRNAVINASKGVIEINNTAVGSVDGTNPIKEGETDLLTRALTEMCDTKKNPNLATVYDSIKSKFTPGILELDEEKKEEVEETPVKIEDSENVYAINLSAESVLAHPIKAITKTRRVDTRMAWLVVGPHPNATKAENGKKGLYILDSLKDGVGDDINIESSEAILSAGGKVVRRIRRDKNGEMKIEYYKGKDKRAYFALRAQEDPATTNIKDWADKYGTGKDGFDNPKVLELTAMPKTYQGRRILSCVAAGVVAVTLLAGAAYHAYDAYSDSVNAYNQSVIAAYDSVPNEASKAEQYGATQMQKLIAGLDGDLLNYSYAGSGLASGVSVGNINNIDYVGINIYQQQTYVSFDGKEIGEGKFDYTLDTIRGAFKELGKQVAAEANENNYVVATRESADANISIRYIYGVVDPHSAASSLLSKENMVDYLESKYNGVYDSVSVDDVVDTAVSAYEAGYNDKATELVIANPDIVIDSSEIPVVDYEDSRVQSAVAATVAKLSENAKEYSAAEINLAYSSYQDQIIFANTTDGLYLFKIDLTNGGKDTSEITSNEDMITKITNADNCVESVQLDALIKRLNLTKALDHLKKTYANENAVTDPQFYVSGQIPTQSKDDLDKLEIAPRITVVSDNGGRIEEENYDIVRTNIGDGVAISEMVALSVFGDAVSDRYPTCERISREADEVVYENNDLTVDEGNVLEENTATVVSKKSAVKDTGRTL